MKTTYEFVREERETGGYEYSTRKNGYHVAGSLRFDKEEAYAIFLKLVSEPPFVPERTVLELIEREEV